MLKTFSPKINKNFKAFSINVSNIKTFHSYQFPNFLNNTTNNSNKEKLNKLYKKIYEEKNNLKHIYVSQIINKNKSEKNESVSIKIKPKIINEINRNFITSEKRFMKYHGFNKRNKYKFNMNSYDKIKDKYYNVNSIKIIQLFLKKKLNIISKDVKTARNDCEIAKNDLISVYDSFNSQIQKKIDDLSKEDDNRVVLENNDLEYKEPVKHRGFSSSSITYEEPELIEDNTLNMIEDKPDSELAEAKIRELVNALNNQGVKISYDKFKFDNISQFVIKVVDNE